MGCLKIQSLQETIEARKRYRYDQLLITSLLYF